MERADVVHVRADVRVRRVKGRLRPHRGVPLGRYPDEGDVGESRTSRQRGRPAGETESGFSEIVSAKGVAQFSRSPSECDGVAVYSNTCCSRSLAAPHSSSSLRGHLLGSKAALTAAS